MSNLRLYDLLLENGCTSKETAMPFERAIKILGLTCRRDLYDLVSHERETTVILPNGKGGYYLPNSETDEGRAEMSRFYRRMRKMGLSTMKAAKTVKEALGNVQGQSDLNL